MALLLRSAEIQPLFGDLYIDYVNIPPLPWLKYAGGGGTFYLKRIQRNFKHFLSVKVLPGYRGPYRGPYRGVKFESVTLSGSLAGSPNGGVIVG